jgi:hypothetical protein
MCFVRKGMEKIFTQEELKWLDDIMPEVHKRAKEDALKRQDKEEVSPGKSRIVFHKQLGARFCFVLIYSLWKLTTYKHSIVALVMTSTGRDEHELQRFGDFDLLNFLSFRRI